MTRSPLVAEHYDAISHRAAEISPNSDGYFLRQLAISPSGTVVGDSGLYHPITTHTECS